MPDEAGKSMATLSNVFNIPITKLTALGDAINHISNNSAAAARGIVPALAKAGGAARQFGITAEQTSALVGTLIAMGRAPEEAGTATVAILQRLQLADKLGPKAEKAFRKIGISAKVFGKMISDDAQGALVKFFDDVSKIQGQDRAGVLVDIFGKNYSSTVATLVGSLDKYKDQLNLISDPKKYAGSMEKEFITIAATTENSFQLLKNGISELSIALGDSLLPVVNGTISAIGNALKGITNWINANPELTRTTTTAVAGLGAFRLATFAIGYAATFLFGGLNKLIIVFKGLRLGLSLLGAAFKVSLGWIGAFATAGWLIYENWESVQKFLGRIWEPIKPYWDSFKNKMDELGVTDFITKAWTPIKELFSNIWDGAIQSWNLFTTKLQEFGVIDTIKQKWESLKSFFKGIFDYLSPIIDKITSPLKNLWSGAKQGLQKIGNLFSSDSKAVGSKIELTKKSQQTQM